MLGVGGIASAAFTAKTVSSPSLCDVIRQQGRPQFTNHVSDALIETIPNFQLTKINQKFINAIN